MNFVQIYLEKRKWPSNVKKFIVPYLEQQNIICYFDTPDNNNYPEC